MTRQQPALLAAGAAIERELLSGTDYSMSQESDEALARVALLAAAPVLAPVVAAALREAAIAEWDRDDSDGPCIEIYVAQITPIVERVIKEVAGG